MKTLWLLRHAKSSWKYPALEDIERPLKKRGTHDAALMGRRAHTLGHRPQLIVSSPAKRTQQTAGLFAAEIGYQEADIVTDASIYEASASALLESVRRLPSDYYEILLCGHNPGFTDLIDRLARVELDNLPTAGIACLVFSVAAWTDCAEGGAELIYFDTPRRKRGMPQRTQGL